MTPSRSARRAGLSTGWRVSSLTMRKISSRARPAASSLDQPVRRSATAFSDTIRAAASVTMTPSPIDCSVVRSRSASRRCPSRVRRSASAPALISQPVPAKIRMPTTCAGLSPSASMRGARKKLVVMAALSAVASRPGRSPPYHAAAMMAP